MEAQEALETSGLAGKDTTQAVAIVGGGPAGLSVARALKVLGIPFTLFERHSDTGGIWDRENPGSPMYESAHFISSKALSGHQGFPMPDYYPDYPSNALILRYIRDFAKKFKLYDDIQFNTEVISANPTQAGWHVTTDHNGEQKTETYGWLVCANGTNWHPSRPEIKGEDNFDGEVMHSVHYTGAEMVRGKKVVVLGAGNSGVDIACDAASQGESAYISLRRGYHFLPKHIFGMPVDVFGEQSKWMPMWFQQRSFGLLLRILNGDLGKLGLPKPDHKVLSSHPIVNSQLLHYLQHGDIAAKPDIDRLEGKHVHFKGGSKVEADLVVLATGYDWHIPYLSPNALDWKDDRPQMFLKIFTRKHPNLFINGFVETNGGAYKLFDYTASLIAQTIAAQRSDPEKAQQIAHYIRRANPDLSGKVKYVKTARHSGYTNTDAFRKAMAEMRKTCNLQDPDQFFN